MPRSPEAAVAGAGRAVGTHKIGLIPCLAFAVGTMVGGGVFALSGTAVNNAGPAAIVSYLLAGLVMLLSAFSFVAVAGRAKPGDSGYGPIAPILGQTWRFLTMWAFYLNGVMIITFLLVSFGAYLNKYFVSPLAPTAAGLLAIGAIGALNLGPADLVGKAETWIVAIKVTLLLFFVAWGLAKISGPQFHPFAPGGAHSVFKMSALLFTSYTGFNVVTNMAGSVKRPERTVPLAIIGSVIISAFIYVGVVLAMLASGVHEFGDAGVAQAAQALMGNWGAYLLAFAACLSTLSGANANLLGASEVMLRLVAQGDAPPAAGRTTKRGHPLASVLFIAAVSVILVLVANMNNIVTFANVGALVAMIIVNAAAFRLARQGWPGRGIKLPGGIAIPVAGMLATLAQFPTLGGKQVAVGLVLVASGLVLFGARHWQGFGADVVREIDTAMETLATPLAYALRRIERHPEGNSEKIQPLAPHPGR